VNTALPELEVQRLAAERAAAGAAAASPPDGAPAPPPAPPAQGAPGAPAQAPQPVANAQPLITEEAVRFGAECIFNPLFRWRKIEELDEEELDTVAKGYTPAFNKWAPGFLRDYPELFAFTVATVCIAAPRLKRKAPEITPEVEAELRRRGYAPPAVKVPEELLREAERQGWAKSAPPKQEKKDEAAP
jgi:hypothetical protein